MLHDKELDLVKFNDEIKQLLEGEIVSRYYFQNGRIEAYFKSDEELARSVELLSNLDNYNSLLR